MNQPLDLNDETTRRYVERSVGDLGEDAWYAFQRWEAGRDWGRYFIARLLPLNKLTREKIAAVFNTGTALVDEVQARLEAKTAHPPDFLPE